MKHSAAHLSLQVRHKSLGRRMLDHWQIYLLLLPAIVYFIIFYYWPMAGLQIAFRDYRVSKGIWGSTWVGLKYFQKFFNHPQCWKIIRNTMVLSLYTLATFPLSVIMALLINELRGKRFQKTVQMVTYAPYFISTVVMVGMLIQLMSIRSGFFNHLIQIFGGTPVDFMAIPSLFRTIYVFSGVWQGMGYSAVIYIAALAGVSPDLHEAATIDGATRLQRIIHINLPAIMPTIVIMLIMAVGGIMNLSFEKVLLMQTDSNTAVSEVISTYVYKLGIQRAQYSLSAAVGLFNNIINLILLVTVNKVSRKISETSLW